ncbi:MAG: TlpA family protein disulfide reductase [Prevotellaceae bacterium]|jgi:thiol-disulfide isomerase/thioredoxin|nr:TlpA family protein disulfide reductase [Prevotellaceae bacterium]
MKTPKWFTLLLLPALMACNSFNNRGLIENPQVLGTNTTSIEVAMIELTDTATVLHIKAFYRPHNWIRIASSSFLRDNKGGMFAIREGDGITLDEEFWMPDSGEAAFNLIFQPIPADITSIDFSEGDNVEGAYKIWGIQLTGKPIAVTLPRGFQKPVADLAAPLPTVEQKAGKARIEGQILNYTPDMTKEIGLTVNYPFRTVSLQVAVDDAGKFATEVDAFSPHPVMAGEHLCFIAPGETTTLLINPAEIARRNSHLHKDDPKIGEAVYFGGYLAALSREIAENNLIDQLHGRLFNTQQEYNDFLLTIADKNVTQFKEMLLKEYNDRNAAIDATAYSAACKELLHITNDLRFADELFSVRGYMVEGYSFKNKQQDMKALSKYAETIVYPADFYHVLKQLKYINAPERCYSLLNNRYLSVREMMTFVLGTDKGYLFDVYDAYDAYMRISDFQPLDSAQLAAVPQIYRAYMQQENEKVIETIEASKLKSGYEVKEITPDMQGKEIIPQIIARHKGKPILIDIWATWCGPCRRANKELAPVKEELKDKGIVYVFIAGEDSPKETWDVMIADLHGEHYRVTDKQWSELRNAYGATGVPTYLYVDKAGTIVKKQVGFGSAAPMKEQLLEIAK